MAGGSKMTQARPERKKTFKESIQHELKYGKGSTRGGRSRTKDTGKGGKGGGKGEQKAPTEKRKAAPLEIEELGDFSNARTDDKLTEFISTSWWLLCDTPAGQKKPTPEFAEKAKKAYDARCLQHEALMRTDSEQKWMRTVVRNGTLADRVAGLVMMTQMCPLFSVQWIQALLDLSGKSGRKDSLMAIEALKELFCENLLPDRRLAFMHQRTMPKVMPTSQVEEDKVLATMWFEDFLKTAFATFVQIMVGASQDDNEHYKNQVIALAQDILVKKPEQEKALLGLLINKLGDTMPKVPGRVANLLKAVTEQHPNMCSVIAQEVDRFLNRENISRKAKFFGLTFLSDMKFRKDEGKLPAQLVDIHLRHLEKFTQDTFNPEKKKRKRGEKVKHFREHGNISEEDNRIIRALINGLNRAFPYLPKENHVVLEPEMIGQLFKLVHIAPSHATRILLLRFLYKFMSAYQAVPDRLYRAVYEQINSFEMFDATYKYMLLNLLGEMIAEDSNKARAQAIVKRTMQVTGNGDAALIVAALMMIKDADKKAEKTVIPPMLELKNDEDSDEEKFGDQASDGEEKFGDQASDGEEKTAPKDETKSKPQDKKGFDPLCRDPKYAGADKSHLWEMYAFGNHYHPWIREAAEVVRGGTVAGKHIECYNGDPFKDFSATYFLDRFTYAKNPAKKEEDKKKKNVMFSAAVNADQFINKETVAPHERFFHQYFNDSIIAEARYKVAMYSAGVDQSLEGDELAEAKEDAFLDAYLHSKMKNNTEDGDVDDDSDGDLSGPDEDWNEVDEDDAAAFAKMDGVEDFDEGEELPDDLVNEFSDLSGDEVADGADDNSDDELGEINDSDFDTDDSEDEPPQKRTKHDAQQLKNRLKKYKTNAFASAEDFADLMSGSDSD